MYLFVYGSIKKGFSNDYILKDAKLIAKEAITKDRFLMYPAKHYQYPYVVIPKSKNEAKQIKGELYKVSEDYLKNVIDVFEECPTYYNRIETKILANQKIYNAQIYIKSDLTPEELDKSIILDKWSKHLEKKSK